MKENSLSPYKMESACENEALCQELSDSGRFKLRRISKLCAPLL